LTSHYEKFQRRKISEKKNCLWKDKMRKRNFEKKVFSEIKKWTEREISRQKAGDKRRDANKKFFKNETISK